MTNIFLYFYGVFAQTPANLSVYEEVVINLFNFLDTIKHLHFTPFVFTSSRYRIVF